MISSLLSAAAGELPQAPQKWKHWQLPEQASTFAQEHDSLYTFVEWINYIFFFGICLVLFYAVVKYRRKTPDQPPASTITHHTALEVTWTVIPLIIVMVIFAWGWKGYSDMTLAPADSLQYELKGKRWNWSFKHPNDTEWYVNELWVPVDTPIQVTMSSRDVLHSFYIPAFRVKRDVLPGRYQTVWFKPTVVTWNSDADREKGFHIFCTEFCGEGHSKMIGKIHVVTKEKWKEFQAPGADKPWSPWTGDVVANGEIVYRQECSSCHTINGDKGTGPSFKGLFGKKEVVTAYNDDGSTEDAEVVVDEAYITESIRYPAKKVVKTYPKLGMTQFTESKLNADKVEWVIEYLKTLK